MDVIDVIVPVHRGLAATRRCLDSVLAADAQAAFETVVVDDATPEPEIARYLDDLAAEKRITLLRNARNLGFVQSVNRGMALHADRDVLLLNSDTEVANDWLARLSRCVRTHADIGTATPFSNNATICSYPYPGWTAGVPGTVGLAALDRLCATANAGKSVDLPTGVGFCLYIRRACLDQVGAFDAERFGRGYGEENDFCLRAIAAGWRNVLAGDVFVYHEGAVSFAGERSERTNAALETLLTLHPDYPRMVREFVAADPAGPLRHAVDIARIAHGRDEAASVLAEHAEEKSHLRVQRDDIEALAAERLAANTELRAALAHAEAILSERDAENARLRDEIGKLGAGMQYAEKLAIERMKEIERIHASPMWKVLAPFLRKK